MRCRRCDALMVETRKVSSATSEQTWFGCPACDTVKMHTLPRQSEVPSIDVDPGMETNIDNIDSVDTGNEPTDRSDDVYVSPLSYSN